MCVSVHVGNENVRLTSVCESVAVRELCQVVTVAVGHVDLIDPYFGRKISFFYQ